MIKVTLKDGSIKEIDQGMAVIDVAKSISEGLARVATCAKVDGKVVDLRCKIEKDCNLEILTFDATTSVYFLFKALYIFHKRKTFHSRRNFTLVISHRLNRFSMMQID